MYYVPNTTEAIIIDARAKKKFVITYSLLLVCIIRQDTVQLHTMWLKPDFILLLVTVDKMAWACNLPDQPFHGRAIYKHPLFIYKQKKCPILANVWNFFFLKVLRLKTLSWNFVTTWLLFFSWWIKVFGRIKVHKYQVTHYTETAR